LECPNFLLDAKCGGSYRSNIMQRREEQFPGCQLRFDTITVRKQAIAAAQIEIVLSI